MEKAVDLMQRLFSIGFLTGSRAFGTEKDDSDYDIVVPCYEDWDSLLGNCPRTASNYFNGIKIECEGGEVNIIIVHQHDFAVWFYATKAMAASYKISGIDDRIKRLALFEAFRASFKGLLPALGTLERYKELNSSLAGK